MAIRNPLTQEVDDINQRIRNRQDINELARDELFGLLKNQPEKRIIIDTTFNNWFSAISTNITDIQNRIGTINTRLGVLNTAITNNETLIQNRDAATNTAIQNAITGDARLWTIDTNITSNEGIRQWFDLQANTATALAANTEYQTLIWQITQIDNNLWWTITNDERKWFEAQKKTVITKQGQVRWEVRRDVEGQLKTIVDTIAELRTQRRERIQEITNEQTTARQIARQTVDATLTKDRAEKEKLETESTTIQNILNYQAILATRSTELTNIQQVINDINVQNTITPQTSVLGWWLTAINLNQRFLNNINRQMQYTFCDNNTGEPLKVQWNTIDITLPNGQAATITWLQIQNGQINATNIQIQPIDAIQFPINIQIAVRGRHQEINTAVNIDHFKTMVLTINAPTLSVNERQLAYNNLNQNNTVNTRLAAEYSEPNRTTIENEVIKEILEENGNKAEIDKIFNNEQQRDLLIQRIRGIPNLIPVFNTAQLQTGFVNEMTRDNRNVPVQYLINRQAFTDYLRLNMEENVKTYVRGEIRNGINTTAQRNNILRTVMNFQSDIINDKLDNNDHTTLDQNVPNVRPQSHPNTRWQRLLGRNSNKNNRTKFFDGRESKTFEDKIDTNTGELWFNLQVAVLGVNKIVTTINIKGEDEPIILDTRDVNEMTHMILRLEATKTGEPINRKLRCRMALNAVKAVVSMSPVTLHRQYQGPAITTIDGQTPTIDRLSTHIKWDNLILRWSVSTNNRQRRNFVIFDEKRYKWLHNINELERGMVTLSTQINGIMDAMGNEFREATSRIKSQPLMGYNTKHYLRWGPIKRLRARIAYGKTNRKFDFDTTATSGNKTVNIKFEKGKFTLSGTFKGKPFICKWRNLGILLRKKMDRLRVFDGVELAIFEKINESMIGQLRTNNLIWPENFCVSDRNQNKTGRVFMMDSNWDLSYIEIEDRNLNPLRNGRTYGRIDFDDLPPQRIRCNEQERREFMQNPLLSGRLIRAMRRRLSLF